MKKKKQAVVSVSGGMDSTGLLLKLLASNKYSKIYVLNFYYGQKHKLEIKRLVKNIEYLNCNINNKTSIEYQKLDLSPVMETFHSALIKGGEAIPEGHYEQENMKLTVVPNRNAIFSSIVYGFALSVATKNNINVDIALGVHSGDHYIYPDCRPEFYHGIQYVFKIGNLESDRVDWKLPFIDGNKTTILKSMIKSCNKLGIDFDIVLGNTNTCYNPKKGKACGKCGSCTERLEAFQNIGQDDPVKYIGNK